MQMIDNHYAALKLIEALFHKGLINKETFENVKLKYPVGFDGEEKSSFSAYLSNLVKDVE